MDHEVFPRRACRRPAGLIVVRVARAVEHHARGDLPGGQAQKKAPAGYGLPQECGRRIDILLPAWRKGRIPHGIGQMVVKRAYCGEFIRPGGPDEECLPHLKIRPVKCG